MNSSGCVECHQVSRMVHEVHNISRRLRGVHVLGGVLWEQEHLVPSTVGLASGECAPQTDAINQTLKHGSNRS